MDPDEESLTESKSFRNQTSVTRVDYESGSEHTRFIDYIISSSCQKVDAVAYNLHGHSTDIKRP